MRRDKLTNNGCNLRGIGLQLKPTELQNRVLSVFRRDHKQSRNLYVSSFRDGLKQIVLHTILPKISRDHCDHPSVTSICVAWASKKRQTDGMIARYNKSECVCQKTKTFDKQETLLNCCWNVIKLRNCYLSRVQVS